MTSDSGATVSVWMSTDANLWREPLRDDARADVCVAGAGIAGLTTAYMLARDGRTVVVLDDGPIGGGETGRTTAHLSNAMDDRYARLERLHGAEGARLAAQSHTRAIDLIESIATGEGLDCGFERLDGFLFGAPGQPPEALEEELAAAVRAGVPGVEMVDRAPITGFDTGRAIRFPNQAQFDPLKYLEGLARCLERDGGRVFTGSHAHEIRGGRDAHVRVKDGPTVWCGAVVVATNTPVNDLFAIHTKQAPYRTYAIGARVPRGSVHRALYWDTLDPYHYVRLRPMADHDVLIVGGEDHRTGHADDILDRHPRLERWASERFPAIERVEFRWSGQVMEPVDGLAFIGRNPADHDNVFIATGDSGQGMTHGTIAGMLLTDLIVGRSNPWERLYDPARKAIGALGEYARENLTAMAGYADYLLPGEVDRVEKIPPGAGALVRHGAALHACYRDESGRVHECSAACTHLGGVVRWNPLERAWECPVHGSRFAPDGRVLNGPALHDLRPVDRAPADRATGPVAGREAEHAPRPAPDPARPAAEAPPPSAPSRRAPGPAHPASPDRGQAPHDEAP